MYLNCVVSYSIKQPKFPCTCNEDAEKLTYLTRAFTSKLGNVTFGIVFFTINLTNV